MDFLGTWTESRKSVFNVAAERFVETIIYAVPYSQSKYATSEHRCVSSGLPTQVCCVKRAEVPCSPCSPLMGTFSRSRACGHDLPLLYCSHCLSIVS